MADPRFPKDERNHAIVRARDVEGLTFPEIAERFGITRPRAWQIYQKSKTLAPKGSRDKLHELTARYRLREKPLVDHTRCVTVPIYDGQTGAVVFFVDVYGLDWRDMAVIPGGADPIIRTLRRMGFDPDRYRASLFDLNDRYYRHRQHLSQVVVINGNGERV